ncbi:MAG: hypothetical protein OXE86_20525 [Alphaproteobacteria bacterium]|nr:hypothetical protein [Alphaproteobacteria bacterium]
MRQGQTSVIPEEASHAAITPAGGLGVRTVPDDVARLFDDPETDSDEPETSGLAGLDLALADEPEATQAHEWHRHAQALYEDLVAGLRRLRAAALRRR